MSAIDLDRTLSELVLEQPARARLFEELELDYCCGGQSSLAEVAAQRGLDAGTLAVALEAAERAGDAGSSERDWREAPLAELCDHIVDVHHAFLRRELPHIGELMAKVIERHGDTQPTLKELDGQFSELRAELIEHIDREEERLFPYCRSLAEGAEPAEIGPQLGMHESAHAAVGRTLAIMRVLGGGYRPERAFCTTHGVLMEALDGLERDLHQHIHEENNVLFPRLREEIEETRVAAGQVGDS